MLQPFKGFTPGNGDATQRQIQERLREIYGVGILGGNLVTVSFPSTANADLVVEHKLGRSTVGYIPVSLSAAGIVYSSPSNNQAPDLQIILRSNTASLRATLWIF